MKRNFHTIHLPTSIRSRSAVYRTLSSARSNTRKVMNKMRIQPRSRIYGMNTQSSIIYTMCALYTYKRSVNAKAPYSEHFLEGPIGVHYREVLLYMDISKQYRYGYIKERFTGLSTEHRLHTVFTVFFKDSILSLFSFS
jgi:hypothetical protein